MDKEKVKPAFLEVKKREKVFEAVFVQHRRRAVFHATWGDLDITFEIDKFFNIGNRARLMDPDRTEMLSLYVNEYGIGEKLMKLYKKAFDQINSTVATPIFPIISSIIKLFKYKNYLKLLEEYGFEAPKELVEVISESDLRNKRKTNEQTYTKSDYKRLLPLIGVLKAIGPVLAYDVKQNIGSYPHKLEYLKLGTAALDLPFEKPIIDKVMDFLQAHKDASKSDDELLLIATNKSVTTEDIIVGIFGNVLFRRLFPVAIQRVPDDMSTIKTMHQAVSSGASLASSITDNIKFKNLATTADTEDKEAWVESFRSTTPFTQGIPPVFNILASDPSIFANLIGLEDMSEYDMYKEHALLLGKKAGGKYPIISSFSIALLKIIIGRAMPIGAIPYLTRDSIITTLVITAMKLKELNLDRLSRFMLLLPTLEVNITTVISIDQVKPETKEELKKLYPNYHGIITNTGETRPTYPVIENINGIVSAFKEERYIHLSPDESGEKFKDATLYKTVKADICRFILDIK